MLHKIKQINDKMPTKRTIEIIALKAGEELGELNEAILTKAGHKNKDYTTLEGVTGEAVDLALCALSIALKDSPLSVVKDIINKKIEKWEKSV